MDTPVFPTITEKHNAMISYCFLAPFMLISKQEQFTGKFVRSHARYATMLHLAFLGLIIGLVQSRNFSTVIIYDFSWIHVVLFLLFFGLLILLGNGIFSALRGKNPRVSLSELSLKSFEKEFTSETRVSEDEKTPIILSHIPLIGMYLAAKYGGNLWHGEKFGTWLSIVGILSLLLDPSMTLLIAIIVMAIFWIVYQAVGTANTSTIHLLGDRLFGGRDAHIFIKSAMKYIKEITQQEQKMPSWNAIHEEISNSYRANTQAEYSPFLFIPIINIPLLIKVRKNKDIQKQMIQGYIITILFLYAWIMSSMFVGAFVVLGGFWAYIQKLFHKDTDMPFFSEIAEGIIQIIKWKEEKSKPEEINLPTFK